MVGPLSLAIFFSLVGALLTLLSGRKSPTLARRVALVSSLVPLLLVTYVLVAIPSAPKDPSGYVFTERYPWIGPLGIQILLGADGVSAPLLFLSALLVTLSIVFGWSEERPHVFHSLLLLLGASLLGVFSSLDLFLFYVFWEFVLIPMYFLIALWGGPRRKYAAIKFFLYTFLGSLVMLLGFMILYFAASPATGRTFDFVELLPRAALLDPTLQKGVFLLLFIGFAVKFPIVPLHTWLPDAHVEAPTSGSVLLAGVLLKMGSYGLIRFGLPLAPLGARDLVDLLFLLAVLSMIYPAALCLVQRDYKKLVAYSSIGSMGVVLLGVACSVRTGNELGLVGANVMMLAHGFISPALFMLCGVLQHSLKTREIPRLGGLASLMPKTATLFVFFSMAGVGLPGLAAFVSEFQVFAAAFEALGIWVLVPLGYLVLSAGYYLTALEKAWFGPFTPKPGMDYSHATDLVWYEALPLGVLAVLTAAYGVFPRLITDLVSAPSKEILLLLGVG